MSELKLKLISAYLLKNAVPSDVLFKTLIDDVCALREALMMYRGEPIFPIVASDDLDWDDLILVADDALKESNARLKKIGVELE